MPDPRALPLLFLLAACAGPAAIALDPAADPRAARRMLAATAEAGPVPVTVMGTAPLATPDLLQSVERGVRGLRITAVAAEEGRRRFVLDFTGQDRPLCDQPAEAAAAVGTTAPIQLRAAFCDGSLPVAMATAPLGERPERLVWRLIARLVPDDYPESYGFDLFGNRVGLGGSFSF